MALLVTTLGFFAGALVAEAQAQTETLSGLTKTNSGSVYGCPIRGPFSVGVGANFNAAGSATGPYLGPFSNTSANANVSGIWGRGPFYIRLTFGIPFTVNSGNTTISGTITNPYPYTGGLFECGAVYGGASNAKYTATIQTGQSAQAISGNAQVILNIPIQPGSPGTITETLALP